MIRANNFRALVILLGSLSLISLAAAQATPPAKPRARDLGVPFDGSPGPFNAITDVFGVTVGHTTLISGAGKLQVGKGPIRTGVTAVLPRGKDSMNDPVFAGWWSLNGNGEMTGTTWVEESGFLEGPVMVTNTHSLGVVTPSFNGASRTASPIPQVIGGHCRLWQRLGTAGSTTSTDST